MRLNLGSGKYFKDEYLNIDYEDFSQFGANFLKHDLEAPLPFEDNSVDEVYCEDVLEHISNLAQLIDEIHRVCKPGAKITFIVPHFTNNTFEFHLRPFRYHMFNDYCLGITKSWHDRIYFKNVKRKITFRSVYSFMGFINTSPFFIKVYEYTFLRSLFFAHSVIFEAEVYKP